MHRGEQHKVLLQYLIDMASNLSECRIGEEEATFSYIMRCMGQVAATSAPHIYEPYGYKNPFISDDTVDEEAEADVPTWSWPIVNMPPDGTSIGPFNAEFRGFSALKMFGYTVGKTDGWTSAKRQKFLGAFMESKLPAEVQEIFGDEYGAPLSSQRLRKMANVIASNASNFYRNDAARYAVAIDDWEEDLQFLKNKYYEGMGLKFQPWPSIRD